MFAPSGFALMVALVPGILACSAVRGVRLQSSTDYGEDEGKVWVRGPWELITPAKDLDEVIDQLCPTVERLDRARDGDDGVEYCGLMYSLPDGMFYASAPSPLGLRIHEGPGQKKSCRIPSQLHEARGTPNVLADFHSHPWPDDPLSKGDLSARTQRWSIRVQFDTTCHVYKYVPHLNEARPGEVFLRVGKTWRLQSIVRLGDKRDGQPTPPLQEVQ